MNMLSLNLSRCPRSRNHGPAGEMASVVVLPVALSRIGIFIKTLPSHAGQGSRICRRPLSGATLTSRPIPSSGGGKNAEFPFEKPFSGTSGAFVFFFQAEDGIRDF